MGPPRKKSAKVPSQLRSRTTRSKGKALADPVENTQLLTEQLRALGLYAANTLGDGNCLFRALSDQLYGTDKYHFSLRKDVCDWIEAHKERYAPFVDDERGLDIHLRCMRQQATYGGHLELSAFAHMTRRNVKVVQPGLVYVIEWNAGGDPVDLVDRSPSPLPPLGLEPQSTDNATQESDKRLTRRERKRLTKASTPIPSRPELPSELSQGPVYVAYHDWEHFSSIRNLRGPHAGLPNVREVTAEEDIELTPPSPTRKKPAGKSGSHAKTKYGSKGAITHTRTAQGTIPEATIFPLTPSQVPLPISRTPSPLTERSESPLTPLVYPLPSISPNPSRSYRSPKRTFEESSASSADSSHSLAKRAKAESHDSLSAVPDLGEEDAETPPLTLSAPGSPSSMSSLSSISSPDPTPPPPAPEERSLTRRQRKQLGLPKPRKALIGGARASAGKIIIPGGRYRRPSASGKTDDLEEWQRNGTGRVDVRGFRELKI